MIEAVEVITIADVMQVGVIGLCAGMGLGLLTHALQSVLDIFKNIVKR